MSLFLNHVLTQLLYSLSYLPYFLMRLQHLFTFEALRCGTYWRAAFKRGRGLFQCNINDLHEISKLWNFLFPNNNEWPPLWCIAFWGLVLIRGRCFLEGSPYSDLSVSATLIWNLALIRGNAVFVYLFDLMMERSIHRLCEINTKW